MDRPLRRLAQLYAGLVLYGASMGLQIRAGLGLDPWDVLHQGVADRTGLSFGTVSNVVVIGVAVDATLAVLPPAGPAPVAVAMLLAGVGLNGVAGGAYIGAGLGPGPRDGLMTGLVRRTGRSVGVVRTSIEVTVLVAGAALGGTVGVGTLVYAFSIGPLVHALLPRMTVAPRAAVARA